MRPFGSQSAGIPEGAKVTRTLYRGGRMERFVGRLAKGEFMYFVSWIIVGLVAGWFGGRILKGNTYGPFMDVGMGIGRAVAGGLLMQVAGFSGYSGSGPTIFGANIGALPLAFV